jgi:hypothetical protein
MVVEEIREKIKNILESNEKKLQPTRSYGI